MAERRVNIGLQERRDGRTEITLQDPQTGQIVKTGHVVPRDKVDKEVREVKEQMERAGNRVSVKDI